MNHLNLRWSVRAAFALSLAVAVLAVEIILGRTVRGVGHRVRFRAGDSMILRMLLSAASLADYRCRVAALALTAVAGHAGAGTMLPDAHFVF
jgi:hypothetical protein